jgi:hypothetical protein
LAVDEYVSCQEVLAGCSGATAWHHSVSVCLCV